MLQCFVGCPCTTCRSATNINIYTAKSSFVQCFSVYGMGRVSKYFLGFGHNVRYNLILSFRPGRLLFTSYIDFFTKDETLDEVENNP